MTKLSNAWSDQVVNDILRTAPGAGSGARPAAVWVALSTTTISKTSTGASIGEPSGNAYARVQVAQTDANWAAPTNGVTSNANDIDFPTPTGSWGTVTDFALVDAETVGTGTIIAFNTLTTQQTIDTGATVRFAAGALTVTAA